MSFENMDKKEIKKKIIDLKGQIQKQVMRIAGCEAWVYGLTGYQMEDWRLLRSSDTADARLSSAKLVQLALRDGDGNRIFEANELTIIGGLPAKELEPIVDTALRLSGFGADAQEAILKNLLRTLGADGLRDLLESIIAQSQSCSKDIQATS